MLEPAFVESRPWYRSTAVVVLASIAFPPLGLLLLLTNPGTETQKKIVGSLAIVILGVLYAFFIFGFPRSFVTNPATEAHYDALEQHRASQRAVATQEPAAAAGSEGNAAGGSTSGGNPSQPAPAANAATKTFKNYWVEFRGPGRTGRYDEAAVLTSWPASGLRQLWKQPIGEGYASFIVAEGRAFTIEKRRNQEVVSSYDLESGRELWTNAWDAEFVEEQGNGPRATPTWDDGKIYALGGTGDLRCIDARTGKLVWSRDTLKENGASNLQWGQAVSPLIVGDKVIVQPGGSSGKSVVAYNKLTGAPAWKVLNDRQAYASPMLVTLAGREQILAVSATRAVGLSAADGELLWEYPWNTQMGINVSQPIVVDNNRFFISAGYSKGCALVEVNRSGNGFAARTIWENNVMKNKFNSSVLHEGFVYGLDEGILTCLNVETGERKWKGGRYGYGQLLLASGHLIVLTDNGELVLVRANPEKHEEVAKFSALEGRCWNYPALASGRLLVRNANEMACYDIAAR
jgi:outer membrane protein assembly factor BamB